MRWGTERAAAPGVVPAVVPAVGLAIAVALAGPAAGATVRVLLLDRRESVQIEPADGGQATAIRIRPGRAGLSVGGRARGAALRFEGPGPQRVDGRRYRGAIEVLARPEGIRVVNEVPLEAYVAGTLLGEVHESWGPAVLDAQAVATRSYVLHRQARATPGADYDVESGTLGQVYLGLDGESQATWSAVEATRGEVLAFGGEAILAAFHGTAGGRTASAAEVWGEPLPYLVSVPVDGEDESPDTYWRAAFSADELGELLARAGDPVGRVRAVEITARTPSGRCAALRIQGRRGTAQLDGEALRAAIGEGRLRSTLFAVRATADGFVFVGSGRGHGVGMSQWGARVMAERGSDYRAILRRFYPGAELRHLPASVGAGATASAGGS
jgi:stage II sporulation protein D